MFMKTPPTARTEIWRYVVTLVITILSYMIAHLPLVLTVSIYATKNGISPEMVDQAIAEGGLTQLGIGPTLAFTTMLLPFAIALATLFTCVHFIHRQPIVTLLTTRQRFDMHRVGVAALIWITMAGGAVFLILPDNELTFQFHWPTFIPFAVIALLLVPLQISAEEILFRGYLFQLIGKFFQRQIWPMLIITCLFAAMHLANPEFKNGFWSVMPAYFGLSLFLGFLAVTDNGLELPIGVHLGNNLFTALIVSTHDGAMNTPSIFQTNVAAIIQNFWVILIVIPAVSIILHFIFQLSWQNLFCKHNPAT